MNINQRICIAAGSIAGISVAVYMVYRYVQANWCSIGNSAEVKTSRPARIEVRVPRKCVGYVIGRGGSSIRTIEQETGSKIFVKKQIEKEDFRIFEICGAPQNAQLAETMFHKIIRTQTDIKTVEIFIPTRACGMIIGKNGQKIRTITKTSNAKIKVGSEVTNEQGQNKVTVSGTEEQIENAKSMIYEAISSTIKVFDRSSELPPSRNPCKHVRAALGFHEGFVEVFVSAMDNPSRFWIQVLGTKSLDLDNLVQKMTRYYAEPRNCMQQNLKEVSVGQLVAAPYGRDGKWYRAKVMEAPENKNTLTLFYLDYGDTDTVARNNVLALDVEFLKLHFQAIECKLASVIADLGEWTNAANNFFRKLCRVAQWKNLEARIMNLLELKFDQNGEIVLVVELYDRENGKNISISDEMVKKGFAKFKPHIIDKK